MFQKENFKKKYVFLIKNKIVEKHKKTGGSMDLQERYDELDNIVFTIRILLDDITIKEYIEQLREIQFKALEELEDVDFQLQKEYDKEYKHQLDTYFKSVL